MDEKRETGFEWPAVERRQRSFGIGRLAVLTAFFVIVALVLATATADEAAIPLGASKIGGRPDLPPGMAWPTRPAYPDAAERAAGHRREADRLLAESKKQGSWMTPAQGERFSADARARADAVRHCVSSDPPRASGREGLGILVRRQ